MNGRPDRCPRCFCRDLLDGETLGFKDESIIIRSFEYEIRQCRDCGFSDLEEVFEDNSPPGTLAVSIILEKEL